MTRAVRVVALACSLCACAVGPARDPTPTPVVRPAATRADVPPRELRTLVDRGAHERAVVVADAWLEQHHDATRAAAEVWALRGWALLGLGLTPAAQSSFQRALELDRSDATALFGLGTRALAADDVAAAVHWLTLAAQADPEAPAIRRALALALRRHGEPANAIVHLERACAAEPSLECDEALGLGYCELDRNEDAQAIVQRLDARTTDGPATIASARIALACGDRLAAEAAYRRVLLEAPSDLALAREYAAALRDGGQLDLANVELRKQVELHADRATDLLDLAGDLAKGGDLAAEELAVERAYDLEPTDPRAATAFILVLVRIGQCTMAQAALDQIAYRLADTEPDVSPDRDAAAELPRSAAGLTAAVRRCVTPIEPAKRRHAR